MATPDHKARARLSFLLQSGTANTGPPAANPSARTSQAHSLRVSTLDDVALALYALAVLCSEDERSRTAGTRPSSAEPLAMPLPPLFREGLVLALQCLQEYADQLGARRAVDA